MASRRARRGVATAIARYANGASSGYGGVFAVFRRGRGGWGVFARGAATGGRWARGVWARVDAGILERRGVGWGRVGVVASRSDVRDPEVRTDICGKWTRGVSRRALFGCTAARSGGRE